MLQLNTTQAQTLWTQLKNPAYMTAITILGLCKENMLWCRIKVKIKLI